jgi:lipoprotein-anchoring transpeptidase ErfK/SrfK
MRRLARLCFSATLCAASSPALPAKDGFMILGLQETQAPASAPADVPPVPAPAPAQRERGGGLIGLLLNDGASEQAVASLATEPAPEGEPEPQFQRQEVDCAGPEAAGTIVVDTPDRFLFLVEPHGKALRYGIGVGRPGFEWAGVKRISRKAEWPDWTPPQMLLRRPDLPRHGRRSRQSARRQSPLPRVLALPDSWH